jgi:hypothetical protein
VAGLLSSPRRRRRLAWFAAVASVIGGIAVVGVVWPNTGTSQQLAQHAGVKAVYIAPESVPFDGARGDEILLLEQQFVDHAVFRHDVGKSYDLVSADLRGGMTRARWAGGEIPVEPYPAEAVKEIRGKLLYSYPERVSLEVRFVPKDGAQVGEQTFDLILGRSGPPGARRWLVTSWLPNGFGVAAPRAAGRRDGIDLRPQPSSKAKLGAAWLALPAGLLGVGLALVGFLAARGWHRHRRAIRTYKESRSTIG